MQDALTTIQRAKLWGPEDPAVLLAEGQVLPGWATRRPPSRRSSRLRQRPGGSRGGVRQALAHPTLGQNSQAVPLAQLLASKRPGDARVQRLLARLAPELDRLRASAQAAATGDPAALREHGDALLGAGSPAKPLISMHLRRPGTDDAELHLRWARPWRRSTVWTRPRRPWRGRRSSPERLAVRGRTWPPCASDGTTTRPSRPGRGCWSTRRRPHGSMFASASGACGKGGALAGWDASSS
ncbi:MAG: hypothetical protein R3F43_25160 [bacterium]